MVAPVAPPCSASPRIQEWQTAAKDRSSWPDRCRKLCRRFLPAAAGFGAALTVSGPVGQRSVCGAKPIVPRFPARLDRQAAQLDLVGHITVSFLTTQTMRLQPCQCPYGPLRHPRCVVAAARAWQRKAPALVAPLRQGRARRPSLPFSVRAGDRQHIALRFQHRGDVGESADLPTALYG